MTVNTPLWENIPSYNYSTGVWSTQTFSSRDVFKFKILSLFKVPGEYNFDESSEIFNQQGNLFNKNGFYCSAPWMTKDFIKYWDDQKIKCRKGIFVTNGDTEYYISRDYYMWINFLPIYDKVDKKYKFPNLWDSQYHMALYELLAELHYKHAAIVKKRQFGSSYFHMAKQLNLYWFEEGAVLKIGASMKDYINEKGSWRFLNEYRNFLNEHTAWYRPNEPDKVLTWQQQIKVRVGGRDTFKGLKSSYSGMSFEKDPTNGVGGPVSIFFHEEAGIAPKMDVTFEYIRPALKSGNITTGLFIAAGSVGELDQCEPLKNMILQPNNNDIYGIDTNLLDDSGTLGISALFIPEQWSMPPFIDRYGNSVVFTPTESQAKDILTKWVELGLDMAQYDPKMGSLEFIQRQRIQEKKDLTPEQFQLRKSQAPTNIAEAFATRKVSIFPPHLIAQQKQRIADGEYPVEYLDLERTSEGKLKAIKSNKGPIKEFPVSKKTEDKEGVICVYERPIENSSWGTYYASIDPISEGKTTTSDSLCSIIVYKNPIEVVKNDGNGNLTNYVERDKIVAVWCGRFDDLNKTHQRLEAIIEWYNAWTIVEVNVSLFIEYMIAQRKQKYLVPKDQMIFMKDLTNSNTYQAYGWKNTGTFFKVHLISYAIQFFQEELDVETTIDGTISKLSYGVERIPDPMLLEECSQYQPGLNVDRLVSFAALVAFAIVQQSNRGIQKRIEVKNDDLYNSSKMSKLNMSPFRHLGGSNSNPNSHKSSRSAFKNLR